MTKKVKNKLLIGVLLFIGFIIATLMFGKSTLENQVISILDNCVKSNKEKFTFIDLDSSVDSLLILHPYTNTQRLKSELGISISGTGIDRRDDVTLIILLKGRKVKEIVFLDLDKFNSKVNAFKIFPKNHEFKFMPKSGEFMIYE